MESVRASLMIRDREIRMEFDPASPVHQTILGELSSGGAYERTSQFLMMRVLNAGDTFLDIGAHIGYFTLLGGALVGESGSVVAVEPIDENFRQLTHHIDLNGLTNVQAVQAVVGADDGEAQIFFNADNDGGHALWDPAQHPANELTRKNPRADRVRSLTLAALLDAHGIGHVRLAKIDTEGAEAMILSAGREVFRAGRVDFVVMEVNIGGLKLLGSDIDRLFGLAIDLGYAVHLPHPEGGRPEPLTDENRPDSRYVYNVVLARPEALDAVWD